MSTQDCPSWCSSHWGADSAIEEDLHRWIGPVEAATSYRGDAQVLITQGVRPGDEATLSWNGESHETDGADARAFAAALLEAADKLDEIRAASAVQGVVGTTTMVELAEMANEAGMPVSELMGLVEDEGRWAVHDGS